MREKHGTCMIHTHTHLHTQVLMELNENEFLEITSYRSVSAALLIIRVWIMMPHQSPMAEKVPSEGVDTVIQKSSRSSSHQSSRHRTRDKSRDRDKDREQAKDWPPEKLSDSHSPVSFLQTNPNPYQNCHAWRITPNFAILMHPVYTLDWHLPHVLALSEPTPEVSA